MENPVDKDRLLLKHQLCKDNNVDITPVQPHFYRAWQVEPCHQLLGWSSQALIFSIEALGALPKQQQPRLSTMWVAGVFEGQAVDSYGKHPLNVGVWIVPSWQLRVYPINDHLPAVSKEQN